MRVGVVDPSLFTLPYDRHLCAGLQVAGAEVTLCGRALRRSESLGPSSFHFVPRCYPLTERGGPGRGGSWYAGWKALEHLGSAVPFTRWLGANFDVVHFQWSPLPLVDAWCWRRLARDRTVIFTVHDTTPFLDRPTSRGQKLGWRRLLDLAHGLIVHTRASRRDLEGLGVSPERISVIPHGPLQPVELRPATAGVGRPAGGPKTLLVFGEIKPYKGIDVLLRALARLPREAKAGWRLVVAGRPRCDVEPLCRLAEGVGMPVEWQLEYLPDADLAALLRGSDAVVFPYRRVDASGAFMLALPFGVPIVATRVGVFREMLDDGVTAVLAAPEDEDSLAAALRKTMQDDDLRSRLRANLRMQLDQLWSWPAIGRAHLEAYLRHRPHRGRPATALAPASRAAAPDAAMPAGH